MPICFADIGQDLIVQRITGSDKVKKHLQELGFTVGEPVKVVSKVDENLIIKIKGISLALSKELAQRILI